jgi:Uri superfamily endonuclease
MKELLKELGFEHLPKLSEFVTKWHIDYRLMRLNLSDLMNYKDFITQSPTKEICEEFEYIISIGGKHLRNSGIWSHLKQFKTIEGAINNGVKLILK